MTPNEFKLLKNHPKRGEYQPAEVEAAISEDKNISEVKVLGVPNDFWGEVV